VADAVFNLFYFICPKGNLIIQINFIVQPYFQFAYPFAMETPESTENFPDLWSYRKK